MRVAALSILCISLVACAAGPGTFSGRYTGDEAASDMPAYAHVPDGFVYQIDDLGAEIHILQTFRASGGRAMRNEWTGPADGNPYPAYSSDQPYSLSVTRERDGGLVMRTYNGAGDLTREEVCRLDQAGFTCRNLPGSAVSRDPFSLVYRRVD